MTTRETDVPPRVVKARLWPFGRVPEIEPRELQSRLLSGESIQVVDVRTEGEFRRGHIHGAVNVPILRLRRELPELSLDRSVPVVAICKTAHRSVPAVRMLSEAGYQASQLANGMDRWRREGLPVDGS